MTKKNNLQDSLKTPIPILSFEIPYFKWSKVTVSKPFTFLFLEKNEPIKFLDSFKWADIFRSWKFFSYFWNFYASKNLRLFFLPEFVPYLNKVISADGTFSCVKNIPGVY
jgi:hypothetical protein